MTKSLSGDELGSRIEAALEVAFKYSQIDGGHHKAWVIDQMVQKLTGTAEAYNRWVADYEREEGDNGKEYSWSLGIAP